MKFYLNKIKMIPILLKLLSFQAHLIGLKIITQEPQVLDLLSNQPKMKLDMYLNKIYERNWWMYSTVIGILLIVKN